MDKIGRYAFLGGVVVSVIAGFISMDWIFAALTVLGLVVGFLNVGATEVQNFLLAAVGLVIISYFGADKIGSLPLVGDVLGRIYSALLAFVSPAAIIVALKSLYTVSKEWYKLNELFVKPPTPINIYLSLYYQPKSSISFINEL